MFKRVFLPLITLCSISLAISTLFTDNIVSYCKFVVAITIIQIIVYQIYRQYVVLMSEKIMNDRIREFSKQGMEITCPCSRACKHLIPIRLDGDNDYRCLDCNKNVAVAVEVKTFLTTEPVDLQKANAAIDTVYDETTKKMINEIQI